MTQVAVVLVNAPDAVMYWFGAFGIATSTLAIDWSSSARPLTKILPSAKAVPSIGREQVHR